MTFTSVLILLAEVGYQLRWWALAAPVAWTAGLLATREVFIRYLLPTFPEGRKPRTLHEYCGQRFNSPTLRRTLALLTIIAFIGTISIECIGLIYAFAAIGLTQPSLAPPILLVVLILFILYARLSGFPGVLATDKLQRTLIALSYIALIVLGAVGILYLNAIELAVRPPQPTLSTGLVALFAFLLLFLFFQLCVADMWQRCYAAQWSPNIIKRMASPSSIALFGLAFTIPVLIGIVASTRIGINPDERYVLLAMCARCLGLVHPVAGVVLTIALFGGFVAGAISTCDTLLVNAGYLHRYDWSQNLQSVSSDTGLRSIKDSIAVFGLAALLFLGPELLSERISLVNLGYAVFSNQIAFFPIVLFAIWGTRRARSVPPVILTGSAVVSFIGCSVLAILGGLIQDDTVVQSAPIVGSGIVILGLIAYLLYGATTRVPSE